MSQTKAQLISDLVQALAFTATASAPTNGMFLSATNELAVSTNSTQRLTVDSSGNVGIGTTSPSVLLHITGSGDTIARVTSADGNGAFLDLGDASDPDGGRIVYDSGSNLTFSTASTERLRITSTGRVAIGTSTVNTDSMLSVHKDNSDASQVRFTNSTTGAGGDNGFIVGIDNNEAARIFNIENGPMRFGTNNTERMRINSAGNLGVGTTSPDALFHARADGDDIKALLFLQNRNAGANSGVQISFSNALNDLSENRLAYIRGLNTGASQNGNHLTFGTNPNGGPPEERMRIDSSGNVGIGTTSPGNTLHLKGAQGVGIRFENSTSTNSSFLTIESGDKYQFNVGGSGFYAWVTGGSEKVRIDGSGRLLVGTSTALTTPTGSRVQVSGNDFATSSIRQTRYQTAEPGASLILSHARGTEASPAILANGDEVGKIRWHAYDGTDFECISAEIKAQIDGTIQENQSPSRLLFSTTASGASSPTERLRITSTGRVGIGTTSPDAKLHVAGTTRLGANDATDAVLEIGAGATGNRNAFIDLVGDTTYSDYGLRVQRDNSGANTTSKILHRGTGDFRIIAQEAAAMEFFTSNTERMKITSSGNVEIGPNGGARLTVTKDSGTGVINLGDFYAPNASQNGLIRLIHRNAANTGTSSIDFYKSYQGGFRVVNNDTASSNYTSLEVAGSESMRVTSAGKVGIGTSSVDEHLHIEGSGSNERIKIENTTSNVAGLVMLNTSRRYDVQVNGSAFQIYDNTGSAERLRIDSSGRVGIGTASPVAGSKLDVAGAAVFGSPSTFFVGDDAGTIGAFLNQTANLPIRFMTNGSERARVTNGGRLLVGTTTDYGRVHIDENGMLPDGGGWLNAAIVTSGSFGGAVSLLDGSKGYTMFCAENGDDFFIRGATSTTANVSGGVKLDNRATSWTSASDEREKENLVSITGAIDKVKTLRTVTGNYTWAPDKDYAFLIAQDVQQVLPEAVSVMNKSAAAEDQRLGIAYTQTIPLLTAALKEAIAKIETLEAKVAALEAE